MKRLVLALSVSTLMLTLAARPCVGQQPDAGAGPAAEADWADAITSPTEEMWFYIQELRRYDDPAQAVRRNAEFRAAQRRTRIATMKWLGYSKSRPTVGVTPYTSFYGAQWVGYPVVQYPSRTDLYHWVGGGATRKADDSPATSIHIQDATIRQASQRR